VRLGAGATAAVARGGPLPFQRGRSRANPVRAQTPRGWAAQTFRACGRQGAKLRRSRSVAERCPKRAPLPPSFNQFPIGAVRPRGDRGSGGKGGGAAGTVALRGWAVATMRAASPRRWLMLIIPGKGQGETIKRNLGPPLPGAIVSPCEEPRWCRSCFPASRLKVSEFNS
jgi:hypothetical protein